MSAVLETTLPVGKAVNRARTTQRAATPVETVVPAIAERACGEFLGGIMEPTKQQIRDRAYFIYLARNGGPGDASADWTQAERELREEFRRAAISGT